MVTIFKIQQQLNHLLTVQWWHLITQMQIGIMLEINTTTGDPPLEVK